MAPPRMVLFDMGNVLLKFSHEQACRQMAEVAGVEPAWVRKLVFESDLQIRFETGTLDRRGFYDAFCAALAAERGAATPAPDFDRLERAGSAIFRLNGPILPLLAQLRLARIRLGVLSNTCASHWNYVTSGRYVFLPRYFDTLALSYELGAMKPAAEIYERTAALARLEPREIFFTDDREENVLGAREAGMQAELFEEVDHLAAQLRAAGLRFNY